MAATVASAPPPLTGATTRRGLGATRCSLRPSATHQRQRRSARASASRRRRCDSSPLPPTVVAFTNTSQGGQDVHVVGLLHGTTSPVIPRSEVRASKNATTIVHVTGSDDDGDPLTWSAGPSTGSPLSSVGISGRLARRLRLQGAADGRHGHVRGDRDRRSAGSRGTCPDQRRRGERPARDQVHRSGRARGHAVRHPDRRLRERSERRSPHHRPRPRKGGTVERVAGTWRFVPARAALLRLLRAARRRRRPEGRSDHQHHDRQARRQGHPRRDGREQAPRDRARRSASLRGHRRRRRGPIPLLNWNFGDGSRGSSRHEGRSPLPAGGHLHREGHRVRRDGRSR